MFASGIRLLTLWTESDIISSKGSELFLRVLLSSWIFVTDKIFSTILSSHAASSVMLRIRWVRSSFDRLRLSLVREEEAPIMLVRGVRRSWEIERSRLARIFSFSPSAISFSFSASAMPCFLNLVIYVLIIREIDNITIKVRG